MREAVGVFDVSHLGKAVVRGPGAAAYVNATLTNDLDRIGPGKAQYTLCCDDATGGVVDDLIAYYRGDDEVFLIPNAANTAEVVRRLAAAAPDGVEVRRPARAATACSPCRDRAATRCSPRSACRPVHVATCRSSRSTWRGHAGGRLPDRLHRRARLRAGAAVGGRRRAVGRRARGGRDARHPRRAASAPATRCAPRWATRLHGQDLSLDITPVQARCGWAVGWKKPAFWGRDALLAEKEAGAARLLLGARGSGAGRSRGRTWRCRRPTAQPVGEVTSGTFSPTRKVGIALALLDRSVVRGRRGGRSTSAAGRPGSGWSSRRSSPRRRVTP